MYGGKTDDALDTTVDERAELGVTRELDALVEGLTVDGACAEISATLESQSEFSQLTLCRRLFVPRESYVSAMGVSREAAQDGC